MRSTNSSTETIRQGSTIRTAVVGIRLVNKVNHFKNWNRQGQRKYVVRPKDRSVEQ
jgi:hypothetical protein